MMRAEEALGIQPPDAKEERRLFSKKTVWDTINPANLLLVVANVLAFVILQTLFFWFIASRSVERVLEDKAGFIATFFSQKGVTKEMMTDYLNSPSNKEELAKVAAQQRKGREQQNWELVQQYIQPIVIGLLSAFLFLSLVMFRRGQPLTRIDMFLLFLVLGAFSTELYFYLTVTSQVIYIGDGEITWRLYSAMTRAAEEHARDQGLPIEPIPTPGLGPP